MPHRVGNVNRYTDMTEWNPHNRLQSTRSLHSTQLNRDGASFRYTVPLNILTVSFLFEDAIGCPANVLRVW
jgi:hypothetical protein